MRGQYQPEADIGSLGYEYVEPPPLRKAVRKYKVSRSTTSRRAALARPGTGRAR